MKLFRYLRALIYGLGLVLSLFGSSLAVCAQGAGQADRDLWSKHGCWSDFYKWQYKAYGMKGSDWAGRGWNDACNVDLEYPKHWNAAFLLTYGLSENQGQQFHGTTDYRKTAEAAASAFHNAIYHVPSDATDIYGGYDPNTGAVKTACPLYDPADSHANPASRAGDFIHEGWHAWLKKYGFNNGSYGGHRPKQGNCTKQDFCDYFYFHGVGAYAFGAMFQNDGTAKRFHSPNQAQVEFLCDIADFPSSWVPTSVRQAAQADANRRSAERFINGPGYYCASPRPW